MDSKASSPSVKKFVVKSPGSDDRIIHAPDIAEAVKDELVSVGKFNRAGLHMNDSQTKAICVIPSIRKSFSVEEVSGEA